MTWFGLIAGGLAAVFLISMALCLFIVGARGDDDAQEEKPLDKEREKKIAAEPARPERKKTLH